MRTPRIGVAAHGNDKAPGADARAGLLASRLLLWLGLAAFAALGGCRKPESTPAAAVPTLELFDTGGAKARRIEAVDVGDSLSIGLQGLPPGEGVEVFLNDDQGKEWSYARLFADRKGNVPTALFWYQSGVIGTTSRKIDFKPEPAFLTFEEAEAYFVEHPLRITAKTLKGKVLAQRDLPVRKRSAPLLYPSNKDGVLLNAANLRDEDLYVTGTHFPAGATVHLFAVDNQFQWQAGDAIVDRTGPKGAAAPETVRLAGDQTRFTVKVWDHRDARAGAFDLIARIGGEIGRARLLDSDILSFAEDTAVLYYLIINGNIVIDSAGRMKDAPAKFEFNDSFEKGEDVYAAVDPTDVPAVHSGGNYAAYWVVDHQPESYWDAPSPALTDVSGGVEIHRVKYWCINVSRRLIWAAATQPQPIKDYDVIVDFGASPAMDAASFVADSIYNKGTDFIDGYDRPGFTVFENPGSVGPFPVGQVELLQPNGISGITDPAGVTGPTYNINLAWARIMYPATAAGTGTPVSGNLANYPVAVFLHGRHRNCDNDGSGPGLVGTYSNSCAVANRIPSHEGYNYIMERLASQGIVSISISAHDIQPDQGIWNYNVRGRLVLKFLDKMRDWNDNGTDPFGAIFNGKLDMSRIALSGHSRGGEGVVAAEVLNATWPSPHSIIAVNAIAPTDQDSMLSYVSTDAAYFLLLGSRDGDLWNYQGFRTYDRAYPDGMAARKPKTVGWVHGANHNYFNTIWTDTAALGSPNPWAGSVDDGPGTLPSLTAAEQRQIGLNTIAAFFRRHLQGIDGYKEILTGRMRPASMRNDLMFWTYQDGERKALDSFEQMPMNPASNTLGGSATAPGFATFAERLFNAGGTDYVGIPPASIDNAFFHDTIGLRLGWATGQTYTSELPAGQRDVSAFTHLTFRAAKRPAAAGAGADLGLLVNIEDSGGHKALWDLSSAQFDRIPHPYNAGNGVQSQMVGVRIPLRNFTQNNSLVDLTDIVRVTIKTSGTDELGIDDIEFGH